MNKIKVKDAVQNGEKIYFKGHAGATYMRDGRTVEDAVDETFRSIPRKLSELPNDADYATRKDVASTLEYAQAKDLSLYNIHGANITRSTANCYIVKEPGLYKIPLVYGNAIKDGVVNTAAYTRVAGSRAMDFVNYKDNVITSPYIETDTGITVAKAEMSISDTEGVFKNEAVIAGNDVNYLAFQVTEVPTTGANAVISVLDAEGVVMWSWHIWVWPDDLTPITITNSTGVNYNILPVNLATKKSANAGKMYNWFYQWGRPTPMLPPSEYNSSTDAANYGVRTFVVSSAKADTYGAGIQNPQICYNSPVSPYNWFGSVSYYNLWDANCVTTGNSDNVVIKTVYDPCPIGFKIPNGNTFTYFTNVARGGVDGCYFKRNAEDTTGVYFPASGFRHAGVLSSVGSQGGVWLSSAKSQDFAYLLYFESLTRQPQYSYRRASGYSVRPVQE